MQYNGINQRPNHSEEARAAIVERNRRLQRDPVVAAKRAVGIAFSTTPWSKMGYRPKVTDKALFEGLAKREFWFFAEYVHRGTYLHAAHTRLICDYLQKVEAGEIKRLIFAMPPRHGKSMTVTETFPAWFILRNPERRVIEVSYSDDFARRFGRANRQKIEEYGDLWGLKLSRDNASVTNWSLEGHRGGLISSGVGGAITGEGADLLVIDDPIKNREEANSPAYQAKLWGEWQNTLLTRLSPTGVVILIQTRWHENDLAGRLLREEPDKWTLVNLPALAEEGDLLGRPVGAPLWPEYGFDLAWAAEKEREVGSYTWAALYQQRPSPLEGGLFKREWWRYFTRAPEYLARIITSWDMTFKDTKAGSYVVGQVWGAIGADRYLLAQVRKRMDFVETLSAVQTLHEQWPEASAIYVEDKANGPAIISSLRRVIPGIIAVTPEGPKIERWMAVTPQVESGNVYLPEPTLNPWVQDFIEEAAAAPNGAYDDQLDTMAQALLRLRGHHLSKPSKGLATVGSTRAKGVAVW